MKQVFKPHYMSYYTLSRRAADSLSNFLHYNFITYERSVCGCGFHFEIYIQRKSAVDYVNGYLDTIDHYNLETP